MDAQTQSTAAALYDGGWRSTDKDELIQEYGFTSDEAEAICEVLLSYENR